MPAPLVSVARSQRFGCCIELTEVQFLGSNSGLGVLILKIGKFKSEEKAGDLGHLSSIVKRQKAEHSQKIHSNRSTYCGSLFNTREQETIKGTERASPLYTIFHR